MSKAKFGFPTSAATATQFSEARGRNDDPNNLYYNAIIVNNSTDTTSSAGDPSITFQDTRALPILQDTSKYEISVENFTINGAGKTLPVFIPQIRHYKGNATDAGPNEIYLNRNPNNTIYDVTFTWQYGGTQSEPTQVYQSTRSVQWIPANRAKWQIQPNAFPNYRYSQPETEYYYCYSYTHWVNLTNAALACAWGDVKTVVETAGIKFGTKCPFFTYDEKTNLFSLWQDSNTTCVPYGESIGFPLSSASPTDPPNPLGLYGPAKSDPSYSDGEYSFVGYNTNMESLISNFDTTYLSTGFPYPAAGVLGIQVNPTYPDGNEPCASVVIQEDLEGLISSFEGRVMDVTWNAQPTKVGSTWSFSATPLTSATTLTPIVGDSLVFTMNLADTFAQYIYDGMSLTGRSATNSFVGNVVSFIGTQLTIKASYVEFADTESSEWVFVLTPMVSTSTVAPVVGAPSTFATNLFPTECAFNVGSSVSADGFVGIVSAVSETLTYDDASVSSSVLTYTGQYGAFEVGNVVQGNTSGTTGTIQAIGGLNVATGNILRVSDQSAPYVVGTGITSETASATIVEVSGSNGGPQTSQGILTVAKTYESGGKTYYSGPFAIGDTITDGVASAVITSVSGDNGYSTLSFASQKNPFVIGDIIECYVTLSSTGEPAIASAKIVDIIGDNTGYGTVNITNQNGKFGIGEVIVDNNNNSVATIVSITGTNNGYATITYINQLTTGAPGSFIPNEFLLHDGVAFAQVVLDTQNVINQTEGNIGSLTAITGVEVAGVFTPTSNVVFPAAGVQITGSLSSTTADFGGVVYLESATLLVNNVAGAFYVGDLIVDNVGFGLSASSATISVTATCNGFSYLGNGKLILEGINPITGNGPGIFRPSNIIIDSSAVQTNTVALTVQDVTVNQQYLAGDTVLGLSSGAQGSIVANCGSVPYLNTVATTQLLTVLKDNGSPNFEPGELLQDTRKGVTLVVTDYIPGSFNVGDTLMDNNNQKVIVGIYPTIGITLASNPLLNIPAGTILKQGSATGEVSDGSGVSYEIGVQSGVFTTGAIVWDAIDKMTSYTGSLSGTFTARLEKPVSIPIDTTVTGSVSGASGVIKSASSLSQYVIQTLGGDLFVAADSLLWEVSNSITATNVKLKIELAASRIIPVGTIITQGSATGQILEGEGTSYTIQVLTGVFTNASFTFNETAEVVSVAGSSPQTALVLDDEYTQLTNGTAITSTDPISAVVKSIQPNEQYEFIASDAPSLTTADFYARFSAETSLLVLGDISTSLAIDSLVTDSITSAQGIVSSLAYNANNDVTTITCNRTVGGAFNTNDMLSWSGGSAQLLAFISIIGDQTSTIFGDTVITDLTTNATGTAVTIYYNSTVNRTYIALKNVTGVFYFKDQVSWSGGSGVLEQGNYQSTQYAGTGYSDCFTFELNKPLDIPVSLGATITNTTNLSTGVVTFISQDSTVFAIATLSGTFAVGNVINSDSVISKMVLYSTLTTTTDVLALQQDDVITANRVTLQLSDTSTINLLGALVTDTTSGATGIVMSYIDNNSSNIVVSIQSGVFNDGDTVTIAGASYISALIIDISAITSVTGEVQMVRQYISDYYVTIKTSDTFLFRDVCQWVDGYFTCSNAIINPQRALNLAGPQVIPTFVQAGDGQIFVSGSGSAYNIIPNNDAFPVNTTFDYITGNGKVESVIDPTNNPIVTVSIYSGNLYSYGYNNGYIKTSTNYYVYDIRNILNVEFEDDEYDIANGTKITGADGIIGTIGTSDNNIYSVTISDGYDYFNVGDVVTWVRPTATVGAHTGSTYPITSPTGVFGTSQTIQWSVSGTISANAITSQNLTLVFDSATNLLPEGTVIEVVVGTEPTGVSGITRSNPVPTVSTNIYVVSQLSGIFAIGQVVQWKGATGNVVVSDFPDFQLTNVQGIFPQTGIVRSVRPLIVLNTTVDPSSSSPNSLYNWNSNGTAVVSFVTSNAIYCLKDTVSAPFAAGDAIGYLPFQNYDNSGTAFIKPAGANITFASTTGLTVGSTIYFSGGGLNGGEGKITSVVDKTADIAFKVFYGSGINRTMGTDLISNSISAINYYTSGLLSTQCSSIVQEYYASARVLASAEGSTTIGTIVDYNVSGTSAYITTFKPPSVTTSLTLIDLNGSLVPGTSFADITNQNIGRVADYTQTGLSPITPTTLVVKNVSGTFKPGDTLSNGTVTSYVSQNGYLTVTDITGGSFSPDELIFDTQTLATATFKSRSTFPIGETVTSGATSAVIVSDNGSSMVVDSIVGLNFENGDTITVGAVTATLTSVSNPSITIVPSVVSDPSSNWTFVSTPLTSSSSVGPGAVGTFTTNLTYNQNLLYAGDDITIDQVTTNFTPTQLYYPENVVEVNLPVSNVNRYTVGSAFPTTVDPDLSYIQLTQDFESTSSLWSPACSIVIGTTLINVRNEYNGSPLALGQANVGIGNKTSAGFQHVLLEVPIQVLPQSAWRGLLYYEPKIDTGANLELSKSTLKDLDFQIYWRNRLTNTLTPLSLYNGGSANIRLRFKRIAE